MPGGPRYTQKQKERFLEVLKQTGKVSLACRASGMAVSGVYDHRRKNARFRQAWTDVLDARLVTNVEEAEEALFERGVRGWLEPVYHNGSVVGHRRRYSDTALTRYLQAKKPDEYSERQRLEHSGELTTKASLVILPPLENEKGDDG